MASFVLVHGAGGGSISWRFLAPLLRAAGHDVFAPSLTGLGDRFHLGGPQTDLSTHIQDIAGIIEFEDLRDVILVGHSYGGMVITGVASRLAQRIAHLVYLDGLLPEDGQSCVDMEGGDQLGAMQIEDGWLLVFPEQPGVPQPPSRGQPVGTLREKLRLPAPLEEMPFSRTYVKAAGHPPPPPDQRRGNFWNAAERVRFNPAWRYVELPYGHGLHREAPEAVAGLLLGLAREQPKASA
jgi:pimeloyl-ACP methyl ester carboxylesterase